MNKKKIIKIGIPVAAGCIVLALGIGFAVKNSGKAVKVAPVRLRFPVTVGTFVFTASLLI